MTILSLFLTILILLFPLPSWAQQNHYFQEWAMVTVENISGQGSGFFINSQGYFITNYHVTKGSTMASIRIADDRKFEASLVYAEEALDLALYETSLTNTPSLPLASSEEITAGKSVFTISSPLGQKGTVSRGTITDTGVKYAGLSLVATDITAFPGVSGSPLMTSEGLVIGVNTLSLRRNEKTRTLAIDLETLESFLQKSGVSYNTAHLQSLQQAGTVKPPPPLQYTSVLFHLLLWNSVFLLLNLGFFLYNRRLRGTPAEEEEEEEELY